MSRTPCGKVWTAAQATGLFPEAPKLRHLCQITKPHETHECKCGARIAAESGGT